MTHHFFVNPEHGDDGKSGLEPSVALRSSMCAIHRFEGERSEGDDVLLIFIGKGERITA